MIGLFLAAIAYVRAYVVSRHRLGLEVAALRQQLVVFKRKRPRPLLRNLDRFFWVTLRRWWSGWADALIIVKAETVVSWHRTGFRLFWRLRSRPLGRPKINEEIRALIRRMKADNPRWGAPRIHGELLALGFEVSEPTVSRYLQRLKRRINEEKAKRWSAFLRNHREVITAFDFFTVPTLTFRVLYCFFVIEHHRRRILHFKTTAHPTSEWIVQQLREAFPLPCPYRYVVFDRDCKFAGDVRAFLKASGVKSVRTSVRSPWQNGVAERWVASIRGDLLDHVIPLNERHLLRLSQEYIGYYHEDRTHIGLQKETPGGRIREKRPRAASQVVALPRIGGLHHRYSWSEAA
jgi:transposase InsO family protein